jgi:hypothetical protein
MTENDGPEHVEMPYCIIRNYGAQFHGQGRASLAGPVVKFCFQTVTLANPVLVAHPETKK